MADSIPKIPSFHFYCIKKRANSTLKPDTSIEYKTCIFIEKYIISLDNCHCLMLVKCYFTIIAGEYPNYQICDFLMAIILFVRWPPSHFQNGGWKLRFDIANNEKVPICTDTSKIFWWPVSKWHFPCMYCTPHNIPYNLQNWFWYLHNLSQHCIKISFVKVGSYEVMPVGRVVEISDINNKHVTT